MLRWAVDLGIDVDENRAGAGVTVLMALLDYPLLDVDDVAMVATITTHVAGAETLARGDNAGE